MGIQSNKKFPLRIYVINPNFIQKGTHKLHRIINTILAGLPYVKTQEIVGDPENNPCSCTMPCIVVPYTRYIREILFDLLQSIESTRIFNYDMYFYHYTDKSGYHHYRNPQSNYTSIIKLSSIEAADCLLED